MTLMMATPTLFFSQALLDAAKYKTIVAAAVAEGDDLQNE